MAVTYYRLRYRSGDYGAWTTNYDLVKKNADFFKAEIESKVFER